MTEQLFPDFYCIQVPLPKSPLKYLNSYVVKGGGRSLVVDTGLNHRECLETMRTGLSKLDVDLNHTDFFITHLHADHFGLVGRLASRNSRIYFNRPDSELIESWNGFGQMIAYAERNGFPKAELHSALENHPGHKHGSKWVPKLNIINDGDIFEIGAYRFICIITPGHTKGHMCLYEPSRKILIAGDHLLIDITPNIQCWADDQNPLKEYLASLKRVGKLDVALVLPGHRRRFSDHRRRIDELMQHHEDRMTEICDILRSGPKNAYEVASQMSWDIRCETWNEFPVTQRWFATGEAISHLRFLEETKRIVRSKEIIPTTFYLAK
jgi:glyoxylase-like metal-dependent hydrolase (beta-lactamase superfamily II)